MKYKNLHFIKFFFVMILLVIFLAVLILGFCWFFYLLPIDFPGTVGEWITGLSALAGGALTLGGVWWTLKDQEDKRIKDLAIQYKPYLNLDKQLDDYENMYYRDLKFATSYYGDLSNTNPEYITYNQENEHSIKFIYSLKNIGRGNVYNASIEEYSIKNPEYFDMHIMSSKNLVYIGEIIPGQQIALVLYFPPLLRLKNEYLSQNSISTTLNCIIKYTDEFEINTYVLNIYFTLKIEIRETKYSSGVNNVSIIAPVYSISSCMPSLTYN